MSSAYVCSQCCRTAARRAVRLAQHYPHHQQRHASSYRLDDLVSELPQTTSTRYSRPRQKPADVSTAPRQPENLLQYVAASTSNKSTVRPSRRSARSDAEPKPQESSPAISSTRRSRSGDAALISYTSALEDLLAKNDVAGAWAYFQTHYTSHDCPALDPTCLSFVDVPKHKAGLVYGRLLSFMTNRWLAEVQSQPTTATISSPSPLAIIDKFDQLAISSPRICSGIAWSLAIHLQVAASKGIHVLEHPSSKTVFVQLMDVWPRCFFPRVKSTDVAIYRHRFLNLLAKPGDKLSDFPASLLLAHDLLCRADSLPEDLEQYRPLLTALDAAALHTDLNPLAVQHAEMKLKRKVAPEALTDLNPEELLKRLIRPSRARVLQTVSQKDIANPEEPRNLSESVDKRAKRLVMWIGHAVDKQNLDTIERLWIQAQSVFQDEQRQSQENVSPLLRLYEAFLVAFFELRRPQAGMQVWNSMIQSGFEPSIRTWNVMMKSCHISRDIDIMESMWHRMRESGIQPDIISWSTRIYGHLRTGSVRDGMSALDDMGKEWFASQRQRQSRSSTGSDMPEVPKPNTAILNSAISALRGKRSHHIGSVLTWSQSFNIEPDVVTYNALLNITLSAGQTGEAAKLLQRMAATNVQPDSATFTVLVNSMLSTSMLNELSHAEQEDKIMELISSFEACGLKVDVQGYALLIDRVLKEHGNLGAAQKVLAHMMARKVERTPHIYTILMTHYFDADPPELYAADALWNDIQNSRKTTLDVIFYDRMVEGFARHGDVGRTMAFLNRMTKEGKRPGWLAMMAVVQCLARNHEWDRVAQIVVDCHKQEGLLSVGLRGRKGQKDFWQYVGNLGENELSGTEHGRDILAIVEAQAEALGM